MTGENLYFVSCLCPLVLAEKKQANKKDGQAPQLSGRDESSSRRRGVAERSIER